MNLAYPRLMRSYKVRTNPLRRSVGIPRGPFYERNGDVPEPACSLSPALLKRGGPGPSWGPWLSAGRRWTRHPPSPSSYLLEGSLGEEASEDAGQGRPEEGEIGGVRPRHHGDEGEEREVVQEPEEASRGQRSPHPAEVRETEVVKNVDRDEGEIFLRAGGREP